MQQGLTLYVARPVPVLILFGHLIITRGYLCCNFAKLNDKKECKIAPYPGADQILDMAKKTARQMIGSGDADHAVALPSMGLPDPPPVDPIAVACDVGEDDTEVSFPDGVAVGVELEDEAAAAGVAADLRPNPIQKVNR